jgi:hypothetical protein
MAPGVTAGGKAEGMGAVVNGGLSDVESLWSDVVIEGRPDTGPPAPTPRAQNGSRKSRRTPAGAIFTLLKRLWIPLVVVVVVVAGGWTVSRLHGIFGNERSLSYGDTSNDEAKPINPKLLRYEVFGPPGTAADISYFDAAGDPQYIEGVELPWSLEFPITAATGVGSVAAQGDSDSIGCRLLVDNTVKAEKTTNAVSAFTSCLLKAA